MRIVIKYILWILAKLVLLRHRPFVVAITGSVGKSTTKEAIFTVLDHKFSGQVRRNQENLNTEIGVPLTIIGGEDAKRNVFSWVSNFILGIDAIFSSRYPKILVLEMAADKPGDIDYLTKLVRPDVGVITAIGEDPVHLEFYPSREALVKEKSFVIRRLKPGGIAVLNFDDETVRSLAGVINNNRQIITYGFDSGSDVRGMNPHYNLPETPEKIGQSGMSFLMGYRNNKSEVRIRGSFGKGVLYATLAAAAVGIGKKMGLGKISGALKNLRPLKGRMTLRAGNKNTIVIDDTYNASPLSVGVALETLDKFRGRRKVAIIGDMRELGAASERAHLKVVRRAKTVADKVLLVGENMKGAVDKYDNLTWFKSVGELNDKIEDIVEENDVLLFKASRAIGLEKTILKIIKH